MMAHFVPLAILSLMLAAPDLASAGNWRIDRLDDRTLALTGDYSGDLAETVLPQLEPAYGLGGWKRDLFVETTPAREIIRRRPALVEMLRDTPDIRVKSNYFLFPKPAVARYGFWMNPTGLFRWDGDAAGGMITKNAEVAYHLFLQFSRPLRLGERLSITLPDGVVLRHVHNPRIPSALYKYNQVGYSPKAGSKYAYLGAWMGTAGPMPLERYVGRRFRIRRSNGTLAFTGVIRARGEDPVNDDGAPMTGEETLELDFSAFRGTGRFYFCIDGIGRSEEFSISDDGMAESFYTHARGLYHKRCGIAKTAPHTKWTAPACHQTVYRGNFPPHERHYGAGDPSRNYGFYDAQGNSLSFGQFELIENCAPKNAEALTAPGGWHDAADYDRRPLHLEIVGDLATVYLLRPGNFCDGQLDLPESGNGIPDILDEALWGLRHLLAAQHPDGGVGTWFETRRHPMPGEGTAADDPERYYISCATRASSIEYAGYAALLAVALRECGAAAPSDKLRDSAVRAWRFAMNPENRAVQLYNIYGNTVFYYEPEELPPEFVVKAGLALSHLCGDDDFLAAASAAAPAAIQTMRNDGWRWSPFIWFELELFPEQSAAMGELAGVRRDAIIEQAGQMLKQEEEAYPYRVPWFALESGWAHTMSWGTWHPLKRARTLVAAHAITGRREYLDGAYIACDFHNGANPFGACMTSGLGRRYPVRFLDLPSYADGIAEFVPGLTPYRNTYGIARDDIKLAHGLFLKAREVMDFPGSAISLMPASGLSEEECAWEMAKCWPVWRRWANVEGYSVAASEYTVWETVAPAATVTGYLLNGARKPKHQWNRTPATNIRELPGFAPLP